MTNFKLNRMSISIIGAFFAPVLIANGSVPYDGFGQEASGSAASQAASQDANGSSVPSRSPSRMSRFRRY